MGEELYGGAHRPGGPRLPCRVYAPVGSHEELLPYLVRRLLENGANTSFVNRIVDESLPVEDVVGDPVADVEHAASGPHPRIPLPRGLFGAERANSAGVNLAGRRARSAASRPAAARRSRSALRARPIVGGEEQDGERRECRSPADLARIVGEAADADAALAQRAIELAAARPARAGTASRPRRARACCATRPIASSATRRASSGSASREAGKTVPDSIAEVREAVDFLRYYAARAEERFRPAAGRCRGRPASRTG